MKKKTVVALLATMTLTAGSVGTVFAMNSSQFSDVKSNTSYYNYIETVVDARIMNAESETEFGVAETESRGDFIKALHTLAKSPLTLDDSSFEDVKGTDLELAVRWAEVKNLFEGLDPDFFVDGQFNPDKELTREEMAVILYNYGKYVDGLDMNRGVGSYDTFADHEDNKVSDTYAEHVKWAVGNKLLAGDDRLTDEVENNLRPTANINKVEVAEALCQYISLRDTVNAEKNAAQNEAASKETGVDEKATVTNTDIQENQSSETVEPEETPEVEPETPETKPEQPDGGKPVEPEGKPDQPETPDEKPHEHTWVDNMVEVTYPEVGHWEEVEVKPAWVEKVEHEAEYEDKWVIDKEAVYEDVVHPAEYEKQWKVDKEAVYEEINHPAEYDKQWVITKEAWVEQKEHPAEGEYQNVLVKEAWDEPVYETQIRDVCSYCGAVLGGNGAAEQHSIDHALNDGISAGYETKEVQVQVDTIHHEAEYTTKWVETKAAWTEEIPHDEEGYYEDVKVKDEWVEKKLISEEEGHYEDVKVKDEWTEKKLVAEEEGHYEDVKVKDAWTEEIEHGAEYEDKWVVDQEEYTEMTNQGEICSECGEIR